MASRDADRRRLRADAQSELELALAVMAEIRAIDLNKITTRRRASMTRTRTPASRRAMAST
ncbi:hypothetical protein EMGBD4_05780 [Verrucomicrobiota bacterium]|nr:hypothetical protein EMGBD4_05780 [Verrucomicrobiota bacterium]